MTFNCSIGRFDLVDIGDSQLCSPKLNYLEKYLVLDLNNNDDDCHKEDSIPFLWVLWIFVGLAIFALVVIVAFFIHKSWKNKETNQSTSKPKYWKILWQQQGFKFLTNFHSISQVLNNLLVEPWPCLIRRFPKDYIQCNNRRKCSLLLLWKEGFQWKMTLSSVQSEKWWT